MFRMELANLIRMRPLDRERFPLVFSPGLDFEERTLPIDPYYLGAWLGNGNRQDTGISNLTGPEVINWLRNYATFLGIRVIDAPANNHITHYVVNDSNHVSDPEYIPENNQDFVYIPDIRNNLLNKVYIALLGLNVTGRNVNGTVPIIDFKHIPNIFKFNSRQVRLKVLAGLIGYNRQCDRFSFAQSGIQHARLFHDTVFLARSLGFHCQRPYTLGFKMRVVLT